MLFTIDHIIHPNADYLLTITADDPRRETILVSASILIEDRDELYLIGRRLGTTTPLPDGTQTRTGLATITDNAYLTGGTRITTHGTGSTTTLLIPKTDTARLKHVLLEQARADRPTK